MGNVRHQYQAKLLPIFSKINNIRIKIELLLALSVALITFLPQ